MNLTEPSQKLSLSPRMPGTRGRCATGPLGPDKSRSGPELGTDSGAGDRAEGNRSLPGSRLRWRRARRRARHRGVQRIRPGELRFYLESRGWSSAPSGSEGKGLEFYHPDFPDVDLLLTIITPVPPLIQGSMVFQDEVSTSVLEPYPRRVTTGLMSTLALVSNAIESGEPGRILSAIDKGVSANLCEAPEMMKPVGDGSRLDISVSWV
jgi:hypothetical protein